MPVQRVQILTSKLPGDGKWITGTVEYENSRRKLVKYDEYWREQIGDSYEWVDNDSNKFKKLSQEPTPYVTLNTNVDEKYLNKRLFKENDQFKPEPIYFQSQASNKHFIIISNPNSVYVYDIETNQYQLFCHYPSNIHPSLDTKYVSPLIPSYLLSIKYPSNSTALDTKNGILYTIHRNGLVTLNMNDKTWNILIADRSFTFTDDAAAIFVPDPINELHFVTGTQHKRYDNDQKKFVHVGTIRGHQYHSTLFYVKSMKKLFLFETKGNHNVYCCDVTENNQKSHDWKIFPVEIPAFEDAAISVVLAYDHIAFILVQNTYCGYLLQCAVFCLDLLYKKICISNKVGPRVKYIVRGNMVKCDDNMVHHLFHDHLKWSLNGMVPEEIEIIYRKSYSDPLVFGYTKKKEERMNMNIPFYLKQIIVAFYPPYFDIYH